jgi:hypothetical protein
MKTRTVKIGTVCVWGSASGRKRVNRDGGQGTWRMDFIYGIEQRPLAIALSGRGGG